MYIRDTWYERRFEWNGRDARSFRKSWHGSSCHDIIVADLWSPERAISQRIRLSIEPGYSGSSCNPPSYVFNGDLSVPNSLTHAMSKAREIANIAKILHKSQRYRNFTFLLSSPSDTFNDGRNLCVFRTAGIEFLSRSLAEPRWFLRHAGEIAASWVSHFYIEASACSRFQVHLKPCNAVI